MASDEKRMSESLIDNVQRKLLEKISSQALHLGNLNNDLREAAEYIKICELNLARLEEAVSASQSLRESHEQSNLENKALIQKLLLEVEDKGQKHNQCEKKLAESRREAQKIRVQLETAQHSLRLASQPSGQADHENQLKVNARLRSEVMALNSRIRSYRDQLQAVQSAPLHQGTLEAVPSRKSRVVCDAATLGKLASNNPKKSPALSSIQRFGKQNEGRDHSSVGSAVDDKCSSQSYKKIATQDNKQCTSLEGEGEILRRDTAAMHSAESDTKTKTLEDERDALLDYIQEDLTKSAEIGLRLEESVIELSNCKKSHCEMQERAGVLESRLENEVMRTSILVSDLNASQMHATRIEEQYRIESGCKSEEAKKGAYIISVLTGELKTARNKLIELEEEVSRKGVISNIEQQQQQQQRVLVDASLAITGFEHSRKLTIELLSLRRLRDEWELEKVQRPRAVDAALLELTTDLTALAERDTLSAPHREMSEISMKLGAPVPSSSTTAADAVAATRGKPGYSDRYAFLRQSSDPHYMGSCSSSRSSSKGHCKPTLEDELSAQMSSARLSQMHAYWLALPSIGVISPLLHTKIKELASDLLYMELACVEIEENIRTTYSEAELASATDKMEISKLHSLNYALERNLEEAKKRIEKMESAGEDESGLRVILDNIVIALLAAPGGVDRLLDDELLNSISSREFASSKRREEKNILMRNLLEQSSGTPLQLLGPDPIPVPHPQQYCSNCNKLYLDSDMPSLSSTHYSLQRESKITSTAMEYKGSTWDGTLSDIPDIVTRLMLVASTALMRLQEDEAARATAFSTLIKCQSALRISNDEYDHLSRKLDSAREDNEASNIAMQDKEMRLTADLNFATDLVERQNAHIMTSEAKLQVTEREKHLLNAQLTAAGQKISTSTQTLHNMLLSFAQSAGMNLGSNSIDLVPGNFEYLFEYARLLFSKLLQSHKHATLSYAQSEGIHTRLDKDRERDRKRRIEKERDRDKDRGRARARDKDVTSATKVESISSEVRVRDGDSDEHGDDSMGGEEGRSDEQYDFMFSKDDSRYVDDEITENKAVNESLLAAYLPILQGGSGSGSGVGSVSKANDSDRGVRASILPTSPSSSSKQRQEQEQGARAGAGGGISMNGAGQYSQRSTRSNGEKRDGEIRDGRLIPSDHYHPQQLRQQHQQQSHHRQQLQERDHTGSTDIEMSSTDFIRYLRARRKDGPDPSNSSVQRDLFRSSHSDSTVASG